MKAAEKHRSGRANESGFTLYFVAISLTMLLGIAALTIDLASLYVARNEAQRAADAAALAGAKVFAESGCLNSGTCDTLEASARQRAMDVGNQNQVAGQAVSISVGNVSYDVSNLANPRVTVRVSVPTINTFFARAFGIMSGSVSTTATAEAYNPSGTVGGPTFCASCVRPWFIGNCDPSHVAPQNPLCQGTQAYLLNPGDNSVANPGCVTGGGVVGETLDIKIETQTAQFGAVDNGSGAPGYQDSITTCRTGSLTCGNTFNTRPGPNVSYTTAGVDTLLHLPINSIGLNQGQDWIDTSVCPPQIHAGALNPLVLQRTLTTDAPVSTSDSLVTVLVYDGLQLPGGPQTNIPIVGFAQVFVTQVDTNGDVWSVILNVAGCGGNTGTCGAAGSISGSGAGMIPVRLISN